ncbi:MAG: helix-turn-helix domain-containing protein [Alphaproteobacteria bacterium]
MTPFGSKVRALRGDRGITLKTMASDLEISEAYLSSLEHGHRGRPSEALVVQVCEYFNLIWDDYEEMHRLAALSHPKITVDTSGLSETHTELANTLAEKIRDLSDQDAAAILARLRGDLY